MEMAFAITAFVTLFVIIDPVGLTPIFVALTQGKSQSQRFWIALRCCLIALGLLTLFAIAGESVLGAVGISLAAFRISGGILLFLTALDMLFERRTARREDQADDPGDDPSVFPLAIPLIAGPGAMTTMILLTSTSGAGWMLTLGIIAVMSAVLLSVFLMFLTAGIWERLLGGTGIKVVTRLLGMLLAALSVQFVLDGLSDFGLVP